MGLRVFATFSLFEILQRVAASPVYVQRTIIHVFQSSVFTALMVLFVTLINTPVMFSAVGACFMVGGAVYSRYKYLQKNAAATVAPSASAVPCPYDAVVEPVIDVQAILVEQSIVAQQERIKARKLKEMMDLEFSEDMVEGEYNDCEWDDEYMERERESEEPIDVVGSHSSNSHSSNSHNSNSHNSNSHSSNSHNSNSHNSNSHSSNSHSSNSHNQSDVVGSQQSSGGVNLPDSPDVPDSSDSSDSSNLQGQDPSDVGDVDGVGDHSHSNSSNSMNDYIWGGKWLEPLEPGEAEHMSSDSDDLNVYFRSHSGDADWG